MPPMMRRMAHVPPPSPPIITSAQQARPHTTLTATSTVTRWERRTRTPRDLAANAQDTTAPRAVPYIRREIPEKFLGARTGTTSTAGPEQGFTEQKTTTTTTTSTTTMMESSPARTSNASKMNQLNIPNPPIWLAYFLALLLIFLFLVALLLTLVTFPPKSFRRSTNPFWKNPRTWFRNGRGRYHSIGEDPDSGEHDGTDHFFCPQHPSRAGTTTSTPDLEMRSPGLRKRNPKDLRINTATAQNSYALGISIKRPSPTNTGEMSALGSAREFLYGERRSEVGMEGGGSAEQGILRAVEGGIERGAEWISALFSGEVRSGGAEDGLLLRVKDCERDGY